MRKTFVITIVLLIASLVSVTWIQSKVFYQVNHVFFTEDTHYGNITEAEGLSINGKIDFTSQMTWDSTLTIKDGKLVEDISYSLRQFDTKESAESGYTDIVSVVSGDYSDSMIMEAKGLNNPIQEIIDSLQKGEEKTVTVKYSEISPYYLMRATINAEGYNREYYYDGVGIISVSEKTQILMDIEDFFQIPVLEDDSIIVTIGKNSDGSTYMWMDLGGKDTYSAQSRAVVANNGCYITLNNRSSLGKVMDFSKMGGYGIYFIGKDNDGVYDPKSIYLFYVMEPTDEIQYFYISEDQSYLYVLYENDEGVFLRTVDTQSLKTIDQVQLSSNNYCYEYVIEDNVVLLIDYDEQLSICILKDDGNVDLFHQGKMSDIEKDAFYYYNIIRLRQTNKSIKYHDGKLYIVSSISHYYPSLNVIVYDREALQYYGIFNCSLENTLFYDEYNSNMHYRYNEQLSVSFK